VQALFKDAPHLIDEFKQFLPAARGSAPGSGIGGIPTGKSETSGGNQRPLTPHLTGMPPMGHFPEASSLPAPGTGVATGSGGKRRGNASQQAHSGSGPLQGSLETATPAGSTKKRKVEPANVATPKRARRGASTGASAAPNANVGQANPPSAPSAGASLVSANGVPPTSLGEHELFERIKLRIGAPPVYSELLKVLHLFSQDILSLSSMVERVRAFLGSRAPDLFEQFCELVGYSADKNEQGAGTPMGSWAVTLHAAARHMDPVGTPRTDPFTGFTKYNHPAGMDSWQAVGPSYRRIRKGITVGMCSGRDALGRSVLNDEYVSHPPTHTDAGAEDQTHVHRRNPHEEHMSRVEEERYEFDVHLEALGAAIRVLEPISQKLLAMKEEARRTLTLQKALGMPAPSVLKRVLKKLYGDHSVQIFEALCSTPVVAVPLVLKRLKQKDDEWRRQRRDLAKVWRDSDAKNYAKALDYQGAANRTTEKKWAPRALIAEIEAAYLEHRERRLVLVGMAPTVTHHLTLPLSDKSAIRDTLDLLAGIGDTHFTRMRPFLEALFMESDVPTSTPKTNAPARRKLGSNGNIFSFSNSLPTHSGMVCFVNNSLYVLIRQVHMIASRLSSVKERALELARSPPPSANPVAVSLGLQPADFSTNRGDPSGYYSTTLSQLANLASTSSGGDTTRFEDTMRSIYGTTAHVLFGADKALQGAVRQCKEATTDAPAKKLSLLFLAHARTTRAFPAAPSQGATGTTTSLASRYHLETQYRLQAEDTVSRAQSAHSDHVYRIEYVPSSSGTGTTLTVQLLSSQDFISDDEARWSQYVEKYTAAAAAAAAAATPSTGANLDGVPDELSLFKGVRPFLRRNVRRVLKSAAASVSSSTNRSGPGGLGAALTTGVIARSGLQLKICVNTYRLFYLYGTEDLFVRPSHLVSLDKLHFKSYSHFPLEAKWKQGTDLETIQERTERYHRWMLGLEPLRLGWTTQKSENGTYVSSFDGTSSSGQIGQSIPEKHSEEVELAETAPEVTMVEAKPRDSPAAL
jgi:histone deacetylase complex regulatory component SIN3